MGRVTEKSPPLFKFRTIKIRSKMKIFRKTYGVRNLVEWQAIIPAGKGKLVVHFSGGSITAYGVTPATYKTDNPAHQAIIETSKHFRSGRIFLVKSELIKETPDIARAVATAASPAAPAQAPAPVVEEPATPAEPAPAVDEVGEGVATEPAVETPEAEGNRMEFACLEDAKQYLMSTYGYTAGAVRYKKDVKQKAEANGLIFVIEGKEL